MPMDYRVQIRPCRLDDIDAITQILRGSPEAATWSRTSHERLLGQPGTVAFVFESASSVTGFLIARQVAEEGEVLNLAVAAKLRRAGQGSALLLAALAEFRRQRVTRVFLEVRASNKPATAFYKKHGFEPTGTRKRYYQNPEEDAVVMEKKLTE